MITPADSPSSPSNYAAVTPHGQGTAPYDVQAGNDEAAIAAAFGSAVAESGAGVLYPVGPRQAETEALLKSPPGYGDFDIMSGSSAGWPIDMTFGD